jgi:hypothetical protein
MHGRAFAVVLSCAAALSGCAFVTGSTDGYQLDAGTSASCAGDATCAALLLECVSAADCTSEAGPQVCCLAPSTSGVITTCSTAPCPALGAQLCKISTECTGESCIAQHCMLGDASVRIQACGNLPICSAQ